MVLQISIQPECGSSVDGFPAFLFYTEKVLSLISIRRGAPLFSKVPAWWLEGSKVLHSSYLPFHIYTLGFLSTDIGGRDQNHRIRILLSSPSPIQCRLIRGMWCMLSVIPCTVALFGNSWTLIWEAVIGERRETFLAGFIYQSKRKQETQPHRYTDK